MDSNPTPERDINFVLITGAGASRNFGPGGKALPMMGDWSRILLEKLRTAGPQYQEITGLKANMSGSSSRFSLASASGMSKASAELET